MQPIILFGGASPERLVSVASAQHVAETLPEARLWFESSAGAIHELSHAELAAAPRPFEQALVPPRRAEHGSLAQALDGLDPARHALLIAMHGGEAEDGTLQALLEERGLAFTGSGSTASARAFDKVEAKRQLGAQGALLAESQQLSPLRSEAEADAFCRALLSSAPEWVLKPVADGSSIGLLHLTAPDPELVRALCERGVPYLAERFVHGRELTVGVVERVAPHDAATGQARDAETGRGDGCLALPVSEVRLAPAQRFDYAGKYLGRGSEEITPAQLSDDERASAQQLGLLAHRALGCAGYSRTDMILTAAGPVFLETNTLPGLTRASFIPQQLEAAGLRFETFVREQLALAVRRRARA